MSSKFYRIWLGLLILWAVNLAAVSSFAQGLSCRRIFTQYETTRNLREVSRLRLMTFNLENFILEPKKVSDSPKLQTKMQDIAEVLLDQRPDILVLQEVHSQKSLEDFNSIYLKDRYEVIVLSGKSNGMNVAFMVKRDLNINLEIRSHQNFEWFDPIKNEKALIFDRDFPALMIKEPGAENPALIVFANHGKAMRDRPGDPKSEILRAKQIETMSEITRQMAETYGNKVPIIIAGDFNADVQRSPLMKPLKKQFLNAFDVSLKPRTWWERLTHTFHPEKGPTEALEMDAVLVSQSLRHSVISARSYRYRDDSGQPRPLPENQIEKELNPSDHFPVVVDLNIQTALPSR